MGTFPLVKKCPVGFENLNADITPVRHINTPFTIKRNAVGCVKLTRLTTMVAPVQEELPVRRELGHTAVDVTVSDVKRSIRSYGNIRRLVEVLAIQPGLRPGFIALLRWQSVTLALGFALRIFSNGQAQFGFVEFALSNAVGLS